MTQVADAAYIRARRRGALPARRLASLMAGEDRYLDGNVIATLFIAACV